MKVLVIGNGGREHALVWRISRGGHEVIAAPGNPGIETLARCVPVGVGDLDGLAGTGLEGINDESRRWSMPITGGITVRF